MIAATRQLILTIPTLSKTVHQLNISTSQYQHLLSSHFNESIPQSLHDVSVLGDQVKIVTHDTADVPAENSAMRLRRDIASQTLQGAHLGMDRVSSAVVLASDTSPSRGKRQACVDVVTFFQRALGSDFTLLGLTVRLVCRF